MVLAQCIVLIVGEDKKLSYRSLLGEMLLMMCKMSCLTAVIIGATES